MHNVTSFASLGKSAADLKETAKETVGATAAAPLGMYAGALAAPQAVGRLPAFKKLPPHSALGAILLSLMYGGAAGGGVAANAGAELLGSEKGGVGANVGGTLGGAAGGAAGLHAGVAMQDLPKLKNHSGKAMLLATLLGGVGGAMGGRELGKMAAEEEAPKEPKEAPKPKEGEGDVRRQRDEKALRNRHIALSLKRGMSGGMLGAILGGLGAAGNEGGMTGGQGALAGGAGGALAGAGLGAAEGGVKRLLGLDPILDTTLIAQRA